MTNLTCTTYDLIAARALRVSYLLADLVRYASILAAEAHDESYGGVVAAHTNAEYILEDLRSILGDIEANIEYLEKIKMEAEV